MVGCKPSVFTWQVVVNANLASCGAFHALLTDHHFPSKLADFKTCLVRLDCSAFTCNTRLENITTLQDIEPRY